MTKVHGGNLHHIYADTEILSARSLIILSRIPDCRIPYCRFHFAESHIADFFKK